VGLVVRDLELLLEIGLASLPFERCDELDRILPAPASGAHRRLASRPARSLWLAPDALRLLQL